MRWFWGPCAYLLRGVALVAMGQDGWWLASDGNWYPPAYHPDNQRRDVRPWVGVVVALSLMGGFVGCGALVQRGVDGVSEAREERRVWRAGIADDVELVACGESGAFTAGLVVTNRSSERSNYMIEVGFASPDGAEQFDTDLVMVSALRPGQRKQVTAKPWRGEASAYSCEVLDVTRFSDE